MSLASDSRDPLKHFIRHTLGCGCADEVFERIDIDSEDGLTRLVVGQRLLIHLVRLEPRDADVAAIDALIERGRRERDEHGWNRFRLVLPASARDADWRQRFVQDCQGDDRLHLHLIDSHEHERIRALCRRSRTWRADN